MTEPRPDDNTVVVPVVRPGLVDRCLETLYERTPPGFYVYVVDQSAEGLDAEELRSRYANLMVIRTPRTALHPSGNLGFAKAVNLALAVVRTRFATICNDDVEFVHRRWWPAITEVFDDLEKRSPRPPVAVSPTSIKLPSWAIGNPPGHDHCVVPYREEWTDADWRHLVEDEHVVNERLTIRPRTCPRAGEMFCSVVDVGRFTAAGMLNERFYPGGGEDYDFERRARLHGYQCVTTTRSWVFHHWGRSRGWLRGTPTILDRERCWNDLRSIWGPPARWASLSIGDLPPLEFRPW